MPKTFKLATLAATLTLTACVTPGTPSTQPPLSLSAMATIPVGTAPHGIAFSQGYVYVGNTGSGSISVIDANANTKLTDLQTGGVPSYTTTTPDGKIVANVDTTGKVRLIDPANGQHTILQTLDVGKGADHAFFSADGSRLAVTLTDEARLPIFTFAEGLAKAPKLDNYTVGTVAGTGSKHRNMSYKYGYALVPNTGENNLTLLQESSGQLRTLTAGNSPAVAALAGSESNPVAVIGNGASNTVTVTRLSNNESKTVAGGTTPTDVAVTADGQYAYVTNAGSNDVSVIGVTAMQEIARIPVGNRPVHIYIPPVALSAQHAGQVHEQVWVLNDGGDSVSVIDTEANRVIATIAVGKGHHKAAFSPTKAFITNITSGDVSVIDRATVR